MIVVLFLRLYNIYIVNCIEKIGLISCLDDFRPYEIFGQKLHVLDDFLNKLICIVTLDDIYMHTLGVSCVYCMIWEVLRWIPWWFSWHPKTEYMFFIFVNQIGDLFIAHCLSIYSSFWCQQFLDDLLKKFVSKIIGEIFFEILEKLLNSLCSSIRNFVHVIEVECHIWFFYWNYIDIYCWVENI